MMLGDRCADFILGLDQPRAAAAPHHRTKGAHRMILDLFRLDGKAALVTGATRGIGLGIATALAEAGAHVIMSSRQPKPEVVQGAEGPRPQGRLPAGRRRKPAEVQKLVTDATAITGRLDILVNNAGVAQHGETHDFTDENYRKIMDINLDSVFYACQAALGPMRKQKAGVILNIGSISGLHLQRPAAAGRLQRLEGRRPHADQEHRQRLCRRGHPGERDRAGLHRHRHDRGRLRQPRLGAGLEAR